MLLRIILLWSGGVLIIHNLFHGGQWIDVVDAFSTGPISQHNTPHRRVMKHSIQSPGTRISATSTTSTTTKMEGEDENGVIKSTVQRSFETFRWRYSTGKSTSTSTKNNEDIYYNINYRVEGEGPPVLLVHGFGANVNHFRYQFPALAQAGYRVYAVDLLGFGASDKPGNASYSIELFAQILQDFIDAMDESTLQPQRWTIAGNSIGGLCCLTVTTRRPNKIQSIILLNCAGGMTGFRYEDVSWFIRPILFLIQKVVIQGPIGPYFFGNFRTRANVESILREQGVYRNPQNVDEELLEILLAPADDTGACDVFLNVFGGPRVPHRNLCYPTLPVPYWLYGVEPIPGRR